MLPDEDPERDRCRGSHHGRRLWPSRPSEKRGLWVYDDVCATRINDLFRQSAFVLSFLSMIMCVDKTSVSICWYYGVVMYGKLKRDQ